MLIREKSTFFIAFINRNIWVKTFIMLITNFIFYKLQQYYTVNLIFYVE